MNTALEKTHGFIEILTLFSLQVLGLWNTIYVCGVGTKIFFHTEIDTSTSILFSTDSSVGGSGFNMTYRAVMGQCYFLQISCKSFPMLILDSSIFQHKIDFVDQVRKMAACLGFVL